jgi:hypothetical protein
MSRMAAKTWQSLPFVLGGLGCNGLLSLQYALMIYKISLPPYGSNNQANNLIFLQNPFSNETVSLIKFFLSYHNLFTKTIIHIIIHFYHILFYKIVFNDDHSVPSVPSQHFILSFPNSIDSMAFHSV